jgi:hypothetical protein
VRRSFPALVESTPESQRCSPWSSRASDARCSARLPGPNRARQEPQRCSPWSTRGVLSRARWRMAAAPFSSAIPSAPWRARQRRNLAHGGALARVGRPVARLGQPGGAHARIRSGAHRGALARASDARPLGLPGAAHGARARNRSAITRAHGGPVACCYLTGRQAFFHESRTLFFLPPRSFTPYPFPG